MTDSSQGAISEAKVTLVNAVQDDIKLTPNITLNLGLRYEYETAPQDLRAEPQVSRYLDLNAPIPEMQQSPPQIPAGVRALMNQPYKFNGHYQYKAELDDITLSKYFPIRERLHLEFKLEAYNLTNSFVPTDPVMNVLNASFGSTTSQANRGREMQYTLRIHF